MEHSGERHLTMPNNHVTHCSQSNITYTYHIQRRNGWLLRRRHNVAVAIARDDDDANNKNENRRDGYSRSAPRTCLYVSTYFARQVTRVM